MKNEKAIFYSFMDFFYKKEQIKDEYLKMSVEERKIYKMYVYSTCFENEHSKDLIWEYLNGSTESLLELCREYGIRLRKLEKRQKNAIYNRYEIR